MPSGTKMVGRRKRTLPIEIADVDVIFDDARIKLLAQIVALPDHADIKAFGNGVRTAARIYIRDAVEPNSNDLRAEIESLHLAAEKRQYERVAEQLIQLSSRALRRLKDRANRISLQMPKPASLHDPKLRKQACANLARLCEIGRRPVPGRMRPSGRRSRPAWEPVLDAPETRRSPPKRDAERDFVMWLRSAWLEATGELPTATVNPSRPDRPFANFIKECLRLVGAPHANHVELINELARRGKRKKSGLSPINS
jgi:hypothetical protein